MPPAASTGAFFSYNGFYLAVSHSTSPYVTIYKRLSDTFTKIPNPTTLPSGNGAGIAISHNDNYLVVGTSSNPYFEIYKNIPTASKSTGNEDWLNGIRLGYAKESGTTGEEKTVVITHH
ncbi:hypothetical protein D3C76_1390310 [compost metagenome]